MGSNDASAQLTHGQNDPTPPSGKKRWTKRVRTAGSLASALGILVAVWVATQGQITVNRNSRATLQQSEDAQLSTAITAIGSDNTAEEIAGLLLLARNTFSRFTLMNQTEESPSDVFSDYTTALQIFSGYLRSHGESFLAGTGTTATTAQAEAAFGRGYGSPSPDGFPLDMTYAADQVRFLLSTDMASRVAALNAGPNPAIDLSGDELIGQPWSGANFGWIFAYMVGVDLRGADLVKSQWSSRSDLSGAYLQCADLEGANLRGANLSHADLSGADVQGADFRGADLGGAVLTSLYGVASWSRPLTRTTSSPGKWDQGACLQNKSFWRGQPAAVSSTASPSPGPSS